MYATKNVVTNNLYDHVLSHEITQDHISPHMACQFVEIPANLLTGRTWVDDMGPLC
jgi:hypothetical protein